MFPGLGLWLEHNILQTLWGNRIVLSSKACIYVYMSYFYVIGVGGSSYFWTLSHIIC